MRIVQIDQVGDVTIKKSPRAKRVIMKIDHTGQPVVVIPKYVPYIVGETFAKSNTAWLKEHSAQNSKPLISSGTRIGKRHMVQFERDASSLGSTVRSDVIRVRVPNGVSLSDPSVQAEARKAAIRALKKEANEQLPSLIHSLAQQYGHSYSSIRVKAMRSRWGSCTSAGDISLSVWLMQVPDDIQRYVLCHELAHLKHQHHKATFWDEVALMVPNYKTLRSDLKQFTPDLAIA